MFKNYIFDLYGTLVDINTNESKASLWQKLVEIYGFYGAKYDPKEIKKEYKRLCDLETKKLHSHECPEIQIEKVFKQLFELKAVKVDKKTVVLVGQFFRIWSTKYVRLYDGVTDILDELRSKGKKVYLLSNAQQIFTEYEMIYLGIHDKFDGIVISSNESCCKPSKEFYQVLFDRYKLKKKESVMIGNDWISDIQGAKNFGIKSVYLHTNISPRDTIIENVQADYIYEDGNITKIREIIM